MLLWPRNYLLHGVGLRVHVQPMPYAGPQALPLPLADDLAQDGLSLFQTSTGRAHLSLVTHHSDHEIRQTIQACREQAACDPPPPPHEEDQPLFVRQVLDSCGVFCSNSEV